MSYNQRELINIQPEELDIYLAAGWFRMHQTIFTTEILSFDNILYAAIWLRINLKLFEEDRQYKKLKKLNRKFSVSVTDLAITKEDEDLFSVYKEKVSFEAAESLNWLLFGDNNTNVYNTKALRIYDDLRLIGIGFFDEGKSSAAGISAIYHPDYKKYSLGKFMIYEKIMLCKNSNMSFFYPGYFVPGYSAFNYKLSIGSMALEYFETVTKQWKKLDKAIISYYL